MALLETKEYINDSGEIVLFRKYGYIDDNGNEVITGTVEEISSGEETTQLEPEVEETYTTNEVIENQLIIMEAQATIYEEILALKESKS